VATFVPLIIMAFWIGLYPKPFFQILEQPVNQTIAMARPKPEATVNASAQPAPVMVAPTAVVPASGLRVAVKSNAVKSSKGKQ